MGIEGVIFARGDGWKAINCHLRGRGGGLVAWNDASNSEIYGCTVENFGWLGTDRAHGHGIYVQNNATSGPTGSSSKTIGNCLVGYGAYTDTTNGHYALHAFSDGTTVNNISTDECFFHGAVTYRNESNPISGASITNCVVTSAIIGATSGTDGNGCSCGRGSFENTDIVFTGNTMVNTITRVVTGHWASVTMSGVNIYKTDPTWWGYGQHTGPAMPYGDELVNEFDVSDGSGTDQVKFWLNDYDSNRAHFVALALDTDDDLVSVDPSTLLTSGDTYEIFRFPGTVWDTPAYADTWNAGTITVTLSDTTQRAEAFIILKTS